MQVFEWDEEKAAANRRKHGIGFNDASQAMIMGLALTRPSLGRGESRFLTLCECKDRLIAVVWTPRADVIRLISARIARKNEQAQFDQAVGQSAQNRRH